MMVEFVSAQSVTVSAPEFTVKYVDSSYDVPPKYGTDQFTGKTVITQNGYHVDKESAEFKIKNQPFTSYNDSTGNKINVYYNFRCKGQFGTEWMYHPFNEEGYATTRYWSAFGPVNLDNLYIPQSETEYTQKVLELSVLCGNPPLGSQVEFQVQALTGYIHYQGDGYFSFVGQKSGWSNTQILTVGNNTATTATPTPQTSNSEASAEKHESTTAEQPIAQTSVLSELNWEQVTIAVMGIALVALSTALLISHKRKVINKNT
jgi:hypothetical protein